MFCRCWNVAYYDTVDFYLKSESIWITALKWILNVFLYTVSSLLIYGKVAGIYRNPDKVFYIVLGIKFAIFLLVYIEMLIHFFYTYALYFSISAITISVLIQLISE